MAIQVLPRDFKVDTSIGSWLGFYETDSHGNLLPFTIEKGWFNEKQESMPDVTEKNLLKFSLMITMMIRIKT